MIPRRLNLLYMVLMRRILLLAPFAMTLLPGQPLGPSPARAQFAGPQAQGQTARPPPPALPGLAARRAPEPIPADPNANLSPTAALFDAINRGDMAAARDAMNRGASLEERNVLGLTAIDAAVDQGRNDILFYLLSARGAARGAAPPAEASLTPAQRAARDRAAQAEAAAAARAMAQANRGAAVRGPAPATRPRLFANDGGAARPEAGFLGFDAGRGAATGPARGGRRG
ncbi:ankyrin repeat domain-containing protein [Roseomonas eburnea]|uniref:Ankyrin repeat domain-containing protein n=1 Tax=Neoroseomonas eburnea TaxID=1346889 RepID=A0A9X9XJJ0_9PROT|nr:ankyrin repeat domain-containing protein [Neoroseomonas eburnea]